MMRALASLMIAIVLLSPTGAAAADDLYRTSVVVSGKGEERRALGFRECLRIVLVKVSGDPQVVDDVKLEPVSPATLVASFAYRDRYGDKPIHDEQGTYDRPHDLECVFNPARINQLLESTGRKPWLAPRPRLVVFLSIQNRTGDASRLSADSTGARDADMRSSFAAAGEKYGIVVLLPHEGSWRNGQPSSLARLSAMTAAEGGTLPLVGSLTWSDALGWIARWQLVNEGHPHTWQIRGVGFDDAFRNAVQGVVRILSGHGEPEDLPH